MFVALIVIAPFLIREMSQFFGGTTDDYTRFCPGSFKNFFVGNTGNGFILVR
jgi:hypothetical protein